MAMNKKILLCICLAALAVGVISYNWIENISDKRVCHKTLRRQILEVLSDLVPGLSCGSENDSKSRGWLWTFARRVYKHLLSQNDKVHEMFICRLSPGGRFEFQFEVIGYQCVTPIEAGQEAGLSWGYVFISGTVIGCILMFGIDFRLRGQIKEAWRESVMEETGSKPTC